MQQHQSIIYNIGDVGYSHVRCYHLFLLSVNLGPLATNWPLHRYLDGEEEVRLGAS